MNNTDQTIKQKIILNSVMAKYNPDNDVGSPQVTYTDVQLIIIINTLLDRVDELENILIRGEKITELVKVDWKSAYLELAKLFITGG